MSNANRSSITATNSRAVQTQNHAQLPSNYTGFVRYARTKSDGRPSQLPRLHRLDNPAPASADFVSPVYLLDKSQISYHDCRVRRGDEYRVSGHSNVAQKIQEECEAEDRVRYPLFIESDADVAFYEMRAELRRFISGKLGVNPDNALWYFSGGRSLHVHLPNYVASYDGLRRVRSEVDAFNEDTDVPIDRSNYRKKSLARLPQATHAKTGIRKTAVSSDSSDKRLQKRIAQLMNGSTLSGPRPPGANSCREVVYFGLSEELRLLQNISIPIIEQRDRPNKGDNKWKLYNRHPFSPYANTGNGRRSVVIAEVKGGPFCRGDDKESNIDRGTFVPVDIRGAVGADGEYTIWDEYGRIRLSEADYNKWKRKYEIGDTVVVVGGQSRCSRIFQLNDTEQRLVLSELSLDRYSDCEHDGRHRAMDLLRVFGHDVGSPGKNGPSRRQQGAMRNTIQTSPKSEAARYQERAEEGGMETLEHGQISKVANRLLQMRGWEGADEWFREQYGPGYDEWETHRQLRSLAKQFDDLPSFPVVE